MRFTVIKSSFDGLCGPQAYDDIGEVVRDINYSKGWDSIKQLHAAIRK